MSMLLTHFDYTNQFQDTEEITDSSMISISIGSEGKNNNCKITLKNPPVNLLSDGTFQHKWVDSDGLVKFKAVKASQGQVIDEELVNIYAHYTDSDPTIDVQNNDYLLFQGVINQGNIKYKNDTNEIELKCLDRNQVIIDKLAIPSSFKVTDEKNAAEIVKQFVQNGSENSRSNSYGYDSSGNRALGYPFLIDARLFSSGLLSTGTATSVSSRQLIDTSATFLSDGNTKDDWVRNTNTNQTAYILSVDSETTLTLSKNIFTSEVGYQTSNGFIQDFRTDGSVFPDIAYSNINKPLAENLDKLGQVENTNDADEKNPDNGTLINKRGMRWLVDSRNRFHWYYPTDTPDYYMEIGVSTAISPDTTGHLIYTGVDLDNEISGKVNFLIFKAGEDMNYNMIKSYERARFSGSPITKDSLRTWVSIAYEMKKHEEETGNISKGTAGVDNYTYPTSYPVTPSWDSQNRSVSNDSDYNDNFVEEAIIRGKARAQSEFQRLANPRWAGNIPIRGEDIRPGDLINFSDRTHGLISLLLRVQSVSHIISTQQGWQTVLTVEEDELEQQVVI